MLSKYDHLPDHFHDLKTSLQSEFNLLKKAILKNIENIQEAIQSQQAYTMALYGHINSLYTKLVQLDRQVQTHCLYPHPQLDIVQLNTPEYDPDLDGQPDPVTNIQSLNAENVKEDTKSNTTNSEQHTALSQNTNSLSPHQFWMILTTQDTKMPNNQGQSTQVITDPNWKKPRIRG